MTDSFEFPCHDDNQGIIEKCIKPYMKSNHVAVEIGPGGGRWTKQLLDVQQLHLVDINECFFDYLKKRFEDQLYKINFVKTSGSDLKAFTGYSVDYVFSVGVFVHLEMNTIVKYLYEINRILKSGGVAAIQYCDKEKDMAIRIGDCFGRTTYTEMCDFLKTTKFKIIEHNKDLSAHSNMIIMTK